MEEIYLAAFFQDISLLCGGALPPGVGASHEALLQHIIT